MGGPGTGAGGEAEFADIENGTRTERLPGKIDPSGRISVTTFIGLPRPGEVTTEIRAELEKARDEAEAALSDEQIPRRYQGRIRDYFDRLAEDK